MRLRTELNWITSTQLRASHGTPARCTLQFVCYGLRGIYGRFDSKIRFEIESDSRFDSRFDSYAKKTIRSSLLHHVKRQRLVLYRLISYWKMLTSVFACVCKLHQPSTTAIIRATGNILVHVRRNKNRWKRPLLTNKKLNMTRMRLTAEGGWDCLPAVAVTVS